jgi:transposase
MERTEDINRQQPLFLSFDEMLPQDSMARVIDRFIDVCNLQEMGFQAIGSKETGRPAYSADALSRLYVYGYCNSIRSSRKLNSECIRNIEVIWLTGGQKPSHKTIAEFRKNNVRPLQKLFHRFTALCRDWELIGGELVAVDGTKIQASNNKKNNFSRKKLEDRLARIDEKIKEYLCDMDKNDQSEDKEPQVEKSATRLQDLEVRRDKYELYLQQLNESGGNEISEVDPDARLMGNSRDGVMMAYNVQSAVDSKTHIVLNFDVSLNPTDHYQLGNMVKKVKNRFHLKRFTVLADKGYYNGEDLTRVKRYKVKAIVSRQRGCDPKDQPEAYHSDKFQYDKAADCYLCPAGKKLPAHNKKDAPRRNYFDKSACQSCAHRGDCVRGNRPYRTVTRSQYAEIYEEVDKRTKENMHLYKLRQQIVEHPFGTMKFGLQGYYFLLRTRRKVRAEVALLFLSYNLKRAAKALGFDELMRKLGEEKRRFFAFWRIFSVKSFSY